MDLRLSPADADVLIRPSHRGDDDAPLVIPEAPLVRPTQVEAPATPTPVELPVRYLTTKYHVSQAIAALALVVLAPLLALIALVIRWKLGEGVLYRQARVGRDGEDFVILKFRTMGHDRRVARQPVAEDRRRTHKSDHDPRHHPLGRFLRRTSLDELPQLWNVVKGEMTLVGPRPELSEVADAHGFRAHPRHQVLPGLTGLWQVSAHRHDPLHEHIDLDRDYVERVSPRLDLRIIAQSFRLLVRPTGR